MHQQTKFQYFLSFQVHGGATQFLDCKAKFGPTNVQFIERRVMFGVVPLNLTTTKSALLFNESSHHAYFQVNKMVLINVRPKTFYTKLLVYNAVAICLINTKLSRHTILGVTMSCVKFQGWMRITFLTCMRINNVPPD